MPGTLRAPNEVPFSRDELDQMYASHYGVPVQEWQQRRRRSDVAAREAAAAAWAHHGLASERSSGRALCPHAAGRPGLRRAGGGARARSADGADDRGSPGGDPDPDDAAPRGRVGEQEDHRGVGGVQHRPLTARKRAIHQLRADQDGHEREAERCELAGDIAGRSRAADLAQGKRRTADILEGREVVR